MFIWLDVAVLRSIIWPCAVDNHDSTTFTWLLLHEANFNNSGIFMKKKNNFSKIFSHSELSKKDGLMALIGPRTSKLLFFLLKYAMSILKDLEHFFPQSPGHPENLFQTYKINLFIESLKSRNLSCFSCFITLSISF